MMHKKREAVKFNVDFDVLGMENLPAKYTLYRILLSRGAKVKKTNEIHAADRKARPRAEDASLRFTTTLERSSDGFGFEDKMYKLSLLRINNRAAFHKEKKIGSFYINLAEYAVSRETGGEEKKLALSIADNPTPAWISVSVILSSGKGGRHYDDHSDGYSEASGVHTTAETVSHATSYRSLGSIDEDQNVEELEDDVDHPMMAHGEDPCDDDRPLMAHGEDAHHEQQERRAPNSSSRAASGSSRVASGSTPTNRTRSRLDAEIQELGAQLDAVRGELARAQKEHADAIARRESVQRRVGEAAARRAGMQARLEVLKATAALVRVDRDQMQRCGDALERGGAANGIASLLRDEKRRLRERSERAGRSIEETRSAIEEGRTAQTRAHRAVRAAWKGEGDEAKGRGQRSEAAEEAAVKDVRMAIHRERARADKYAAWLKTTTDEKELLEDQVEGLRVELGRAGPKATGAGHGGGQSEMAEMGAEVERVSRLLMQTSTAHAEADLAHGELKLQARRLQETNAKLQSKVQSMEVACRARGV